MVALMSKLEGVRQCPRSQKPMQARLRRWLAKSRAPKQGRPLILRMSVRLRALRAQNPLGPAAAKRVPTPTPCQVGLPRSLKIR